MKVYHIIKNEFDFAVGAFLQPKTYSYKDFRVKKRQIEEELENVRKESFPDFPSRLNCLFVCYDMDDIEFWAIQKSSIYGRQFKVLTLETTKPVYWFSAESYHKYLNGLTNDLHQACVDFWKSNNKTKVNHLADREGITIGPAKIVGIRQANISRENGLELVNELQR